MEERLLNLLLLKGNCENCPLNGYCNSKTNKYETTVCDYVDRHIEVNDDNKLENFINNERD